MLIYVWVITIQRKEHFLCDFVKNVFKIDLGSDTYEQIFFKLNMMIDTTKLYILIPMWMTLVFKQGDIVMRKWNFCSHSNIKWREITQTFAMIDCLREITAEKFCKYYKFGLFEHFLFLFYFTFIFK